MLLYLKAEIYFRLTIPFSLFLVFYSFSKEGYAGIVQKFEAEQIRWMIASRFYEGISSLTADFFSLVCSLYRTISSRIILSNNSGLIILFTS